MKKLNPFLTINSQRGLHEFKSLLHRFASMPAIIQQTTDDVVQGLDGVVFYLDDFQITGNYTNAHVDDLSYRLKKLFSGGEGSYTSAADTQKPHQH